MKTNKQTGEKNTETRKEFAERYFPGVELAYGQGNLGMVTVLSDLQHQIGFGFDGATMEHYRVALNDIKCILIGEDRSKQV